MEDFSVALTCYRYIQKLKHRAETAERRQYSESTSDPGSHSVQSQSPSAGPDVSPRRSSGISAEEGSMGQVYTGVERWSGASAPQNMHHVNAPGSRLQQPLRLFSSTSPQTRGSGNTSNARPNTNGSPQAGVEKMPELLSLNTAMTPKEPDLNEFYGASSTLYFMHTLQTTIASNTSSGSLSPASRPRNRYRSHDLIPPLQAGACNLLPKRSLADMLVSSYFRHVHILYPFVHRPTFETQYEQMWASGKAQDDEWLAILNLIFALGIQFAPGVDNQSAASNRFFGYAQQSLLPGLSSKAELQTLQFVLLKGLYYHYTSNPNQAWNATGLAIRIATTIGVHVNQYPSQYDPLQTEIRQRCWYCCVVLDT